MAESEISSTCNKENINQLISSFNDLNLIEKFTKGKDARKNWCKNISSYNSINIDVFNETCGNIFLKKMTLN